MNIFTIGFTGTSAENFFGRIAESGVRSLIDVRLNNTSQLSAFAKRDDLKFFTENLCGITYQHRPELAPEGMPLKEYRQSADWDSYSRYFLGLMKKRRIEKFFNPGDFADACLLCSEKLPHKCHRRLVAEYLREKWGKINIIHL